MEFNLMETIQVMCYCAINIEELIRTMSLVDGDWENKENDTSL